MTIPNGLDAPSADVDAVEGHDGCASGLWSMPESFLPRLPGKATRFLGFRQLKQHHKKIAVSRAHGTHLPS